MEKLARPKDDLFDNSTMTFGEHLDELRQALVKAIVWLAAGMIIGLYFADKVVLFVQTPLQAAIQKFNADRDLHRLGYDPTDEANKPLHQFLTNNALVWDIIYEIPDEYQSLTMEAMIPGQTGEGTSAKSGSTDNSASDGSTETKDGAETPGTAAATGNAATTGGVGSTDGSASESMVVEPVVMKELLKSLPDPNSLKPKIQLRQNKSGLSSLKIEEPFMIWVKAGLIVGAVFASPMIFYHLWSFVAAGLHAHERKYVYVYLPISVILFISGVVLAFFLVLHYVLTFLLSFNGGMDVAAEPRLSFYINFVLLLPLGFGIAFQLPLVMLFLQRIGLFETQAYVESWKIAVLVIFVISMILTPADVTSMVALAIPLVFLYALGILMCMFIPRGRGMGSSAYDPA